MKNFNYSSIKDKKWDSELLALIASIYKYLGKQDIRELCPSLSLSSVEASLRKMVELGEIRREAQGRATNYIRLK